MVPIQEYNERPDTANDQLMSQLAGMSVYQRGVSV